MHILAYSAMFRNYLGIFRTLVFSKAESEAYSEPYKTSKMEPFAKTVNSYSCFCKLKSFSQNHLFTFPSFFNTSLFFTPEVFILYKKCIVAQVARGHEF